MLACTSRVSLSSECNRRNNIIKLNDWFRNSFNLSLDNHWYERIVLCSLAHFLCCVFPQLCVSCIYRLHITMQLLQYLVELWSSQLYYAPLSSVESVLHTLFQFPVVRMQFYWWVQLCCEWGWGKGVLIRATLQAFLLWQFLWFPFYWTNPLHSHAYFKIMAKAQ